MHTAVPLGTQRPPSARSRRWSCSRGGSRRRPRPTPGRYRGPSSRRGFYLRALCGPRRPRRTASRVHSKAEKIKAKQSKAKQSRVKQSRAEKSKAKQSKAEQSRAKQSKAEQSRAKQSKAEQSRARKSCTKTKCPQVIRTRKTSQHHEDSRGIVPVSLKMYCKPSPLPPSDANLVGDDDVGGEMQGDVPGPGLVHQVAAQRHKLLLHQRRPHLATRGDNPWRGVRGDELVRALLVLSPAGATRTRDRRLHWRARLAARVDCGTSRGRRLFVAWYD